MKRNGWQRMVACACLVLAAVLIAACGSSKSSSSSSSSSASTSSSTGGGSSSAAAAAVKTDEKPVTTIGVTLPLKKKPPTGKTIAFLRCSQPVCNGYELGLAPAAKALGWTVKSIGFQPTPQAEIQAIEDAVRLKVNGIMMSGLPRSVINTALAQAQAAHIPVVDGYTVNPVKAPIIANIANGPDNVFAPTAMANYIASQGCSGNTEVFNIESYPILDYTTAVFEKKLKALCPSVTVSQDLVQATDVGTKIPADVTAALQRNPKIKYVAFAFGDMTLGVSAAMKAAGVKASIVAYGADEPTNVQSIVAGSETADTGYGIPYDSFRALDAFARYFEGMPVTTDTTAPNPGELYTSADAKGVNSWANMAVAPNMAQQWEKLWHVG